jgi:hypothetical protein
MFVTDLFEKQYKINKTVVIIPGGFHPLHPGHISLYQSAVNHFPTADVYMVSTDVQSRRPFPFKVKKQLAVIAGIPADRFVQVRKPFVPKEVTLNYDQDSTAVVFLRSDKDRDVYPIPGGSNYFQLLDKHPQPVRQHSYMAYVPTIEFRAGPNGFTSASEIRSAWPSATAAVKAMIVSDLYPRIAKNAKLIQKVIAIFDRVMGGSLGEQAGTGVIANSRQAKDPRYSMSLTKDVRPGQVDKNLLAFNLK